MHLLEETMKELEPFALDKALRQYGELTQLFEAKEGYTIEEKINRICSGLKLDSDFLNKGFKLLSGGEKTTVLLGKLLIDNPDILLLDEPTNHLDLEAVEWLEGYLKNYKGILIIVSHDRYFLDNTVSKIVEIEDMECKTYKGNYSAFAKQKDEDLRIQYEHYLEQQKKISAMEKTVKDLRNWAMQADNNKFFRRAASIQIKLNKLERIEKPKFERQKIKLDLRSLKRSGNETIKANALFKSYGEKTVFENVDMLVRYGEKVALVGPNGSGKTTLLKILLGQESPDKGTAALGISTKSAYLPQVINFPDVEMTVLEYFRDGFLITEGKAREYLFKYLFFGNSVFKKLKCLSGGEKIRLVLGKLLYDDVNLLILDEPTNHLDIESIEALENALDDFCGTIFFISHDRFFINKICERILEIANYSLKSYSGNYDFYKSIKDLEKLKKEEITLIKSTKPKKTIVIEESRKKCLDNNNLEADIEKLENEIKAIDADMNQNPQDYQLLNELFTKKQNLTKELETILEMWLR